METILEDGRSLEEFSLKWLRTPFCAQIFFKCKVTCWAERKRSADIFKASAKMIMGMKSVVIKWERYDRLERIYCPSGIRLAVRIWVFKMTWKLIGVDWIAAGGSSRIAFKDCYQKAWLFPVSPDCSVVQCCFENAPRRNYSVLHCAQNTWWHSAQPVTKTVLNPPCPHWQQYQWVETEVGVFNALSCSDFSLLHSSGSEVVSVSIGGWLYEGGLPCLE